MTKITLEQFRMMVDTHINYLVPEDIASIVKRYELEEIEVTVLKGDPIVHYITIEHNGNKMRMEIDINSDTESIMWSAERAAQFAIETNMLLEHEFGGAIFAIAAKLNLHPIGFDKDDRGIYMLITSLFSSVQLKVYGGINILGVLIRIGLSKIDTSIILNAMIDADRVAEKIKYTVDSLDDMYQSI